MKKVFGEVGWHVTAQAGGHFLFDSPKKFALRPDIVVRIGDRTVIMDTKWKRLVDDPSNNYGITQADMYQMYAYSKKYNNSDVWLLYPRTNEMGDRTDISFTSDDGVNVRVYFVDVAEIEESLTRLREMVV